jgi:hypothetical protein
MGIFKRNDSSKERVEIELDSKLVKKVTQRVEEPSGPDRLQDIQASAVEDLVARQIKFESPELFNLFFSAGGGYEEKIKGEDVGRLENARSLFGHLKNSAPIQVVGYLIPEQSGAVLITVNGVEIDRLINSAAILARKKITGPTPVKIQVSIVSSKDSIYDRPHLQLRKDNKPPKNNPAKQHTEPIILEP